MKASTTDERFRQQYERFVCTNEACGDGSTEIRSDNVVQKIDPKTGIRTVTALCHSCGRLHENRYELRGGIWVSIDKQPNVITAPARITGFKARLDHNRSMQLAAAS